MDCNRSCCAQEHHHINILNLNSGDEVCYSVVVVEGVVSLDCECPAEKFVEVEQRDGPWCAAPTTCHHVSDNLTFKCLVKLQRGINTFVFKGHDGRFQAPESEDNSIDSACDRISTGMHLLQSLLAEELNKFGYDRRTFQLHSDLDSSAPDCHVFYSDISVEEAHAASADTLWACIGRELMTSPLGKDTHKFVAFLSSTYYEGKALTKLQPSQEDIIKCTRGHVALGGGGLALVHTGCLYTWAASTEEVVSRLSCKSQVDRKFFMDDSNDRGTYGGCYSTSLGTVAHEIGHTFDLGHTTHGIMGPYYHNIHRMFLPDETKPIDNVLNSARYCEMKTSALQERKVVQSPVVTMSKSSGMKISLPTSDFTSKGNQTFVRMDQELRVTWKSPRLQELEEKQPIYITSSGNSGPTSLPLERNSKNADINDKDHFHPTLDQQDVSYFYAQSCLAFLAFNRWINPQDPGGTHACITFDRNRRQITSENGLRAVDIRDATSQSLLHWKFLKSPVVSNFAIPERYIFPDAFSICVIDTLGNVLKLNAFESGTQLET